MFSYLGVGRDLGHAGSPQGGRKCLLFPFALTRVSLFLLPHLISELGNEASAIAVFVTGEKGEIK